MFVWGLCHNIMEVALFAPLLQELQVNPFVGFLGRRLIFDTKTSPIKSLMHLCRKLVLTHCYLYEKEHSKTPRLLFFCNRTIVAFCNRFLQKGDSSNLLNMLGDILEISLTSRAATRSSVSFANQPQTFLVNFCYDREQMRQTWEICLPYNDPASSAFL